VRYVIETECEHGHLTPHMYYANKEGRKCEGGSRRVVEPATPDYEYVASMGWDLNINEIHALIDNALVGLVVIEGEPE